MKDISEGIRLFNESDFFSAHDFFEDCWINCNHEERLFFQGMVQISVGCFHLLGGNINGSLSQFRKGMQKLVHYGPEYRGINLEKLLDEVKSLLNIFNDYSFVENPKKLWDVIPKIEVYN